MQPFIKSYAHCAQLCSCRWPAHALCGSHVFSLDRVTESGRVSVESDSSKDLNLALAVRCTFEQFLHQRPLKMSRNALLHIKVCFVLHVLRSVFRFPPPPPPPVFFPACSQLSVRCFVMSCLFFVPLFFSFCLYFLIHSFMSLFAYVIICLFLVRFMLCFIPQPPNDADML